MSGRIGRLLRLEGLFISPPPGYFHFSNSPPVAAVYVFSTVKTICTGLSRMSVHLKTPTPQELPAGWPYSSEDVSLNAQTTLQMTPAYDRR